MGIIGCWRGTTRVFHWSEYRLGEVDIRLCGGSLAVVHIYKICGVTRSLVMDWGTGGGSLHVQTDLFYSSV